jgi:hypothetical protein
VYLDNPKDLVLRLIIEVYGQEKGAEFESKIASSNVAANLGGE